MHRTRIDLPDKSRRRVTGLLGARLVDLIDLRLSTKQAHWNVKGPGFMELHEFFDELAGRLEGRADELAERITTLGGTALGRSQIVAKHSTVEPYGDDVFLGTKHLVALAERFAALAKSTRAAIDAAGKAGDEVTADLFNEITAGLDKDLWFIEAHLQA